ncbi:MAG: hypothetical protein IJO13_04460, partial [Lachnospiraceae bacterium]|nr:hypothetical protein [Lachnospiraceae bacterium]
KCRRMLRKKIRWFSYGQKFYLCLAVCPEHGYVKGKIRIKKTEDGFIYAVKTQKMVDEAGAELIAAKKEEVKIRRAERSKSKKLATAAAKAEEYKRVLRSDIDCRRRHSFCCISYRLKRSQKLRFLN